MRSELKVDTISEKTSASGVTVDGVLIKDSAIASTSISGLTQGITEIDTWALTANVSSNGTITSNLARYNGTNAGYKGTGMTESSGIFTFPSTGFWLVSVGGHYGVGSDSGGGVTIQATDNNSDYVNIGYNWVGGTGSTTYFGNDNNFVLDITDTSNDKVRFVGDDLDNITIYGNATGRATQFRFMRLGDT